jgi:hypothetical protein
VIPAQILISGSLDGQNKSPAAAQPRPSSSSEASDMMRMTVSVNGLITNIPVLAQAGADGAAVALGANEENVLVSVSARSGRILFVQPHRL